MGCSTLGTGNANGVIKPRKKSQFLQVSVDDLFGLVWRRLATIATHDLFNNWMDRNLNRLSSFDGLNLEHPGALVGGDVFWGEA